MNSRNDSGFRTFVRSDSMEEIYFPFHIYFERPIDVMYWIKFEMKTTCRTTMRKRHF
ncbi:hypothetical protein CBL_00613 [Carabus blaptoides fortunei]